MNQSQETSPAKQPNGSTYQPAQQGGQDPSAASQGDAGRNAAGQPNSSQVSHAPTAAVSPPVDIFEDEGGFMVIADMPGVSKEQLVVRVTGDSLLIEGKASAPDVGGMELVYGEVQTPQYRRSFTLSRELDPGKIEAKLDNGVLRLRIPKAEEAKPRRIEVSAG